MNKGKGGQENDSERPPLESVVVEYLKVEKKKKAAATKASQRRPAKK